MRLLLLRNRRYVVSIAGRVLPCLPESSSRTALTRILRFCQFLWGWSNESDRRRFSREAYARAYPGQDAREFEAQLVRMRAHALATSITYMARSRAGLDCTLVAPCKLGATQGMPCIVTYLHYAIDPVVQMALLATNPERDLRWVVFPTQPNEPLRWEGERALYLAGGAPDSIADRGLSVASPGWMIEALAHVKRGGSVLLALDTPLEPRRPPTVSLQVGRASMPVSPAIASLVAAGGAQLLFAWPELGPGNTWSVRCEAFPELAALVAAASHWIEEHRLHWAGWPYLAWRLQSTEMRRIVQQMEHTGGAARSQTRSTTSRSSMWSRTKTRSSPWPVSRR
jgi:hypothetical protein